jgi:hypothetical protein
MEPEGLGIAEGEPEVVPEPVPLAVAPVPLAVAVAVALALDVQEGCCSHSPSLVQNQQGAHDAFELQIPVQVSVAVWQA